MVNDAAHNDPEENCEMNVIVVNRRPHLCLFATRDIPAGEELRYDYNVPNLPWRKVSTNKQVNVAYFMPFIQKMATPVKTRRDDFTTVTRNCTFYINRLNLELFYFFVKILCLFSQLANRIVQCRQVKVAEMGRISNISDTCQVSAKVKIDKVKQYVSKTKSYIKVKKI